MPKLIYANGKSTFSMMNPNDYGIGFLKICTDKTANTLFAIAHYLYQSFHIHSKRGDWITLWARDIQRHRPPLTLPLEVRMDNTVIKMQFEKKFTSENNTEWYKIVEEGKRIFLKVLSGCNLYNTSISI